MNKQNQLVNGRDVEPNNLMEEVDTLIRLKQYLDNCVLQGCGSNAGLWDETNSISLTRTDTMD